MNDNSSITPKRDGEPDDRPSNREGKTDSPPTEPNKSDAGRAGADAAQSLDSAAPDAGSQSETGDRKKETSRIPLETWTGDQPPASPKRPPTEPIPETIRLKRPAGAAPQAEPGEAPAAPAKESLKHQTSRIVLSDTGAPQPKRPPTAPTPETIRLKRPSAPAGDEASISAAAPEQIEHAKKSETTKIDLVSDSATPLPLTQRKTVKIKRTEKKAVPRTATVARPSAAAESRAEASAASDEMREDVGTFFSLLAVAATLLVAALAYILAAQLLAPDILLPLPSMLAR